jgi:5-methylthioribose kinase
MAGPEFDVLAEPDVAAHLVRRKVLLPGDTATVTVLSGGVSSATYLAETSRGRFVVKQPLPYLSVADEWPSTVTRAGIEAAAMRTLAGLVPDRLPTLADYDFERFVLTMSAAPARWREWRSALLDGEVDLAVGSALGRVLGIWHRRTQQDPAVAGEFASMEVFMELRGDPYHRTVACRRPDCAEAVLACLDELLADRRCLVHGDFSPKNVLAGPDGLWVLDFEVAHFGHPVFDLAFLTHHLVMKAVHRPDRVDQLLRCATGFHAGYREAGGPVTGEPTLVRHTGALLLARVHGKSPAAYLTPAETARVSDLGSRAVHGAVASVAELFTSRSATLA